VGKIIVKLVAAACALVVLLQALKTTFAHLQVVGRKVGKFNELGLQVNLKWSYEHAVRLRCIIHYLPYLLILEQMRGTIRFSRCYFIIIPLQTS
jgi:hypothetical protein